MDHVDFASQGFDKLSVAVTKEVVSLDITPEEREAVLAAGPGIHLRPEEFHAEIERWVRAGNDSSNNTDGSVEPPLVLLDVRNAYETEIGRFIVHKEITVEGSVSDNGAVNRSPSSASSLSENTGAAPISGSSIQHLSVLDPKTRAFSDFKHFVAEHKETLANSRVLMYCTGGVRCERASALLKIHGVGNVAQLSGGIHAYQEAFPHGGFFRGKNFVYDPRLAVPYPFKKDDVVGRCRVCAQPFDSYASKVRCKQCRVLQLVCDDCREGNEAFIKNGVTCEACCVHQSFPPLETNESL